MSDYLIGDVQGCYDSLQRLLNKIEFSLDKDRIFFLGDVVNRGNKSLETLIKLMTTHKKTYKTFMPTYTDLYGPTVGISTPRVPK